MEDNCRIIQVKYIGGRPKTIKVVQEDKPKIKVSKDYSSRSNRRTLNSHSVRLFRLEHRLDNYFGRMIRDSHDIDTLYLNIEMAMKRENYIMLALVLLTLAIGVVVICNS